MSVDFLGGGNSNIFFYLHPGSLGRWWFLTSIFFQLGWFNHQLAKLLDLLLLVDFSLTYFYRIDQHKSLVFVWFWHFWMIFVVPTKNTGPLVTKCWGSDVTWSQMGEEYLVGSFTTFLSTLSRLQFFLNMRSWPLLTFIFQDDILRKGSPSSISCSQLKTLQATWNSL